MEKFFGRQRQVGETHDNLSVKEFEQNTQSLCVVNSFCLEVAKGNCRGDNKRSRKYITNEEDDSPLPKRPRKARKSR